MTKKHFQLVADALNSLKKQGDNIQSGKDATAYLEGYFISAFKQENPNFNAELFSKAVNKK